MTRYQRLYVPLKEVVLWIFITLKNPSTSNGFEPANLGSNSKRHYITEGDYCRDVLQSSAESDPPDSQVVTFCTVVHITVAQCPHYFPLG
jgi:hypothetical protein